jgi:hypothetical protein
VILGTSAALALGGCVAPTSGPTSTPSGSDPAESPAPTETAAPGPAAAIEIGATAIAVVDAEGEVLASAAFDGSGAGMVSMLSTAFGVAPEVQPPTTEDCGAATFYLWGPIEQNLVVRESVDPPSAPYTPLTVSVKAAAVEGLEVRASSGFRVGDDVSAFLATLPAGQVNEAIQFVFDVSGTAEGSTGPAPFGAYAFAESGTEVVYSMGAPGTLGSGYC